MIYYGIGLFFFTEMLAKIYRGGRVRLRFLKYRKSVILFATGLILLEPSSSTLSSDLISILGVNVVVGLFLGGIIGYFTIVEKRGDKYYKQGGWLMTFLFLGVFLLRYAIMLWSRSIVGGPQFEVAIFLIMLGAYSLVKNQVISHKVNQLA